ncbi:unnamed protein product [Absidia cylindrospora]
MAFYPIQKFNKASQINRLTDQEKLDRVPFYVPDAIGDWVHGKDFMESFEGRYGLKSSKVELLSKLLSIQQSPSEYPPSCLVLLMPLKQLMIDELNASSTVDKVVKVFSPLITHHCGLSPTQPVEQPVPALDTRHDNHVQQNEHIPLANQLGCIFFNCLWLWLSQTEMLQLQIS